MPASTSRFRNPKTGKLLSRFSPVLMAAVSFVMPWAMHLSSPQRADAITYYWDNNGATPGFGTASGTWAAPTTNNAVQGWSTDSTGVTLPAGTTTIATGDGENFGTATDGLGSGTITVSGTVSAGNITFGSASGAITLSGGQINMGNSQIIVNNASNTISSVLGGTNPLTKAGTGTLILTGNNTRTGAFTINAGTIRIATAANLGNPSGAVLLNFGGNAILNVTNSFTTAKEFTSIGGSRSITLNIDAGAVLTANGDIRAFSGAGTVTKSGLGTLILGQDNEQLDTDITLTGGTLDVRHAGGIGNDAANDFVLAGAGTTTRLTFNAGTVINGSYQTQGSGANLVVDRVAAGAGVTNSLNRLILNGAHTLNVSAGANVTSGTAGITFTNTTTLNGNAIIDVADPGAADMLLTLGAVTGTNRNLTIQGTGNTTIGGAITTGTGTLTKSGDGLLILNGTNTYTGLTTVNAGGILRVRNSSALGTSAAGTTINGNLADGVLELANNINIASEGFTLGARQGAAIDVPHIRNESGNNIIGGGLTLTTGGSDYNIESAAGLLTINGTLTNINTGTRRIKLSGASNGIINGDINVNISGDNELVKNGAGTWTIGNAANLNEVFVNQGTLIVNGTVGGTTIVNSPAILGGEGTLTGAVSSALGSIISPGIAPGDIGTLGFGSSLDIDGTLLIDINGTGAGSSDLINVAGLLDISGATLDFDLVNVINDPFYIFASYGSLAGQFSSITGLPTQGYEVKYNFQGNNIALVLIPEPATISLLTLGSLGLLRRRRMVG